MATYYPFRPFLSPPRHSYFVFAFAIFGCDVRKLIPNIYERQVPQCEQCFSSTVGMSSIFKSYQDWAMVLKHLRSVK